MSRLLGVFMTSFFSIHLSYTRIYSKQNIYIGNLMVSGSGFPLEHTAQHLMIYWWDPIFSVGVEGEVVWRFGSVQHRKQMLMFNMWTMHSRSIQEDQAGWISISVHAFYICFDAFARCTYQDVIFSP